MYFDIKAIGNFIRNDLNLHWRSVIRREKTWRLRVRFNSGRQHSAKRTIIPRWETADIISFSSTTMTTFHRAKYSYSGAIKLFAGNFCHNIYTEFTLIYLIPFESYKHISALWFYVSNSAYMYKINFSIVKEHIRYECIWTVVEILSGYIMCIIYETFWNFISISSNFRMHFQIAFEYRYDHNNRVWLHRNIIHETYDTRCSNTFIRHLTVNCLHNILNHRMLLHFTQYPRFAVLVKRVTSVIFVRRSLQLDILATIELRRTPE